MGRIRQGNQVPHFHAFLISDQSILSDWLRFFLFFSFLVSAAFLGRIFNNLSGVALGFAGLI
jgi:hypothetical protein